MWQTDILQLHLLVSQRKRPVFVQVCLFVFMYNWGNFNHSLTETDTHSNWCLNKHEVWIINEQGNSINFPDEAYHFPLCSLTATPTQPLHHRFTLCWSAVKRPAHISLTIRFQSSVSVFKLASKVSFLPRTRSFRPGIRRSMKGAEETFTS